MAVFIGPDGALSTAAAAVPPTAQALLASLVADEEDEARASASASGGGTAAAAHQQGRRSCYTTALAVWSPDEQAYAVVDWHLHAERLMRDAGPAEGGDDDDAAASAVAAALASAAQTRAALALRALAAGGGAGRPPPAAAMLVVALGPSRASVVFVKAAPAYAIPPADDDPCARPCPRPLLSVVAAVGSGARREAGAKRCRWVVERRALEAWGAAQPGGPHDEVLLVDGAEGAEAVLEGLVSNFYVVREREREREQGTGGGGGGGEGGNGGGGGSRDALLSSFVLQTAGAVRQDGGGAPPRALPGVAQLRVLEAAARLGLAVADGPPTLADARRPGLWREAFLSSAVRGLAAVGRVSVRRYGGPAGAAREEEVVVRLEAGPVGRLLMAEVLALQRRARLDDDGDGGRP